MFWFICLGCIAIPVIMIIIGLKFSKTPPKKINLNSGYRTKRSMKTQETWDFANQYSGKLFFKWGIIILLISIVILGIFINLSEDVLVLILLILVLAQTAAICVLIIPVENALKEKFDEQGKPRL